MVSLKGYPVERYGIIAVAIAIAISGEQLAAAFLLIGFEIGNSFGRSQEKFKQEISE